MKKVISVVLACVLALSVCLAFAGCSKVPTEDESTTAASEAPAKESVLADGVLTVAMECTYAPYNWTQSDDSNGAVPIKDSNDYANGYDVMMAKRIAEALGVKLEVVKTDWDSLVPGVVSGAYDCVIAGQSPTPGRRESVDFTEPYYYATIVTLTKKDSAFANAKGVQDLTGCVCTSQINTIWYDTCLPQIKDATVQAAQESAPAMLVALNSGACDVVVTDMPTAKGALVAYPDFKMLDFAGTDDDFQVSQSDIDIAISVQKGNTELVEKINEVLAPLSADDYTKLMDQAISIQPLSEE